MQLVFSDTPIDTLPFLQQSIFLAGPSPRSLDDVVDTWRHEAVHELADLGYTGHVFIPLTERLFNGTDDFEGTWTYADQIEWECQARQAADVIVFWVPRTTEMPGFTTNIEFGEDLATNRIVYGRPPNALKCRYLDKRMEMLNKPIHSTLRDTLKSALVGLKHVDRYGPEVLIPQNIFASAQFTKWYESQKAAGHAIDDAKVLSTFVTPSGHMFAFALWADMWIGDERRNKNNEFVFARSDISTVIPFYHDGQDVHFALIEEYRTPARNSAGKVLELPGGSPTKPGMDPLINAQHELQEETGIFIDDVNRFRFVGDRQLLATLASHHAQVYAVELSKEEFEELKANEGSVHGVVEDTERTYLRIGKLSEIGKLDLDYSMIGMIYEAIHMI